MNSVLTFYATDCAFVWFSVSTKLFLLSSYIALFKLVISHSSLQLTVVSVLMIWFSIIQSINIKMLVHCFREGLMSYKQFIQELEDDILPAEAERRYVLQRIPFAMFLSIEICSRFIGIHIDN